MKSASQEHTQISWLLPLWQWPCITIVRPVPNSGELAWPVPSFDKHVIPRISCTFTIGTEPWCLGKQHMNNGRLLGCVDLYVAPTALLPALILCLAWCRAVHCHHQTSVNASLLRKCVSPCEVNQNWLCETDDAGAYHR